MAVLLLNPPTPESNVWIREGRCQQWDIWGAAFPPYSLAMIAGQLRKISVDCLIIDSGPENKTAEQVIEECKMFAPDTVILTSASPTIETDLGWFCNKLKSETDVSTIVAVGIHVSALPEESLRTYPAVDVVVIGEPEDTSKALIEALTSEDTNISDVDGICYRTANGTIKRNKGRSFQADVDSLGYPDWSTVNFSNYKLPILDRSYSMINFSRGCPYSCSYCATHTYNGKKLRNRSVDSLIGEIEYNLDLGVSDFLFWTELMTIDHKHLKEFLNRIISDGLHKTIRWVCNSRVDSADEQLFSLMKKAGCWQIAFGFEFGNDTILKLAKKGGKATTAQGRIAANAAANAGLCVDGHFILGFPGETEETMAETTEYACSLPLTFAHFYACVPFPGTPLYHQAKENSWIAGDITKSFNQDYAGLNGDDIISPETVQRYIRKAYRKFYLRPVTITRGLRIPQNFKEHVNLFQLGFQFYKDTTLST